LPLRDGLTGLGVAGLMLPEAVAYAGIAGLPPGRALAASVAGGLPMRCWGAAVSR
jgi:MFS superfamily sulfate permease-like transporter